MPSYSVVMSFSAPSSEGLRSHWRAAVSWHRVIEGVGYATVQAIVGRRPTQRGIVEQQLSNPSGHTPRLLLAALLRFFRPLLHEALCRFLLGLFLPLVTFTHDFSSRGTHTVYARPCLSVGPIGSGVRHSARCSGLFAAERTLFGKLRSRSAAQENHLALEKVADFRSASGKAVTGTVTRRSVALGNTALLEALSMPEGRPRIAGEKPASRRSPFQCCWRGRQTA